MRFVLVVSCAVILSGCENSDGSFGVPGSPAWFNNTPLEIQIAYFAEICRGYGFTDDTLLMSECVQRERIAAAADGRARAATIMGTYTALQ